MIAGSQVNKQSSQWENQTWTEKIKPTNEIISSIFQVVAVLQNNKK